MTREPILVVDDNPLNLKLTRVVLAGEGYDVRTAMDSDETFAMLRSFRPRLILMDLQLPGMDGLELTRRIKADPATAGIPIVALTAYAMKGDDERARSAGCDGYISKPIDTRSLAGVVKTYL
jgi:CheY-like chemotaxis protein